MEDGDAKHEPLVACIDGEALKAKFEQRMPQYIAIRHYGSTETGWCEFTVHVVHEARQRAQEAPPT
ncbi:hypothetical protein M885DRAFT_622914 [Pelagophyceae sp. CCMP2097]|nr:hypothetical protein M885DRAFT_622914 [Pelagophyceae sp. CCMP2097]